MLGGACVQIAFNLGNAIGAYVGGLALSGGYRYPALAGVPFCVGGFCFIRYLLQEISGEVLSVSIFLCMFAHKY